MRYLYFLFIFIHIFFSVAYAEVKGDFTLNYPYIHYSTKNTLPSNETFCVFQDSRGYIWIGTDRGLVKYDGYEFKTYTTLDGLTDNVVLAINEDSKGNIWYSCLNNIQLGYIDPKMNFHTYDHHKQLLELKREFDQPYIHFDEIFIDGDDKYLLNNRYGYVVINDHGIKYSDLEMYCYSPLENYAQVKVFNHLHFNFAYSNYTNNGYVDYRVDVYNKEEEFKFSYKKHTSLNVYPTIAFEEDTLMWIYDGYHQFMLKGDSLKLNTTLPYQCSIFKLDDQKYIYSIYGSREKEGVIYYSNSPNINDQKIKIFENTRVSSALIDLNGGIWISTLKRGVVYIPKLSSRYIEWKEPVEALLPMDNEIILRSKNLAFSHQYKSDVIQHKDIVLNCSDPFNKFKKISFFGFILNNEDLTYNITPDIEIGSRSIQRLNDSITYLWSNGHIVKVENGNIDVELFREKYMHLTLPYQESIYCFKKDSCILGTRDGFYSYTSDTIVPLNKETKKRVRLIDYFNSSKTLVYSIWGEGITLENKKGQKIRLSVKDGLVSNTINTMYMDENEVLWLGTNKGINTIYLDSITNTFKISTVSQTSNSLSSPNILQIYYSDSILYLGTDLGFDVVDFKLNKEIHEAEIPFHLDSLEINNIAYTEKNYPIILRYDSNNITFHFTAIAFNKLGNVRYRYKLEGLSNEWEYTGERKVSFLQLSPNEYQFHLEVQDEYGNWIALNEQPSFTIEKPYWETGWFRLIILGIVGYIIYYYISNLNKEKAFLKLEKDLLEDKQILSGELNESRQKALSAQLNPHFVFNSLNSIQNFILTRRTELSSDYLSMFSKLMRFVFENSKKLYVPLSDEVEALRLYLELEQVRHNHKFEYKINTDGVNKDQIYMPSLLVQPIIENAIWHGLLHKKEGSKVLEVNFASDTEYLYIEIKDNGVGRGGSRPRPKFIKKQKSSGVELTQKRLNLLTQSSGLKTDFKVVDLFDDNGKSCGTVVRITIPVNLEI